MEQLGTLELLENLKVFAIFKTSIVKFMQLTLNFIYFCLEHKELKLMPRLRLESFATTQIQTDTFNLLCRCGHAKESIEYFLLFCPQLVNQRCTHLKTIGNIGHKLLENLNTILKQTFLFGNISSYTNENAKTFKACVHYFLSSFYFFTK